MSESAKGTATIPRNDWHNSYDSSGFEPDTSLSSSEQAYVGSSYRQWHPAAPEGSIAKPPNQQPVSARASVPRNDWHASHVPSGFESGSTLSSSTQNYAANSYLERPPQMPQLDTVEAPEDAASGPSFHPPQEQSK